MDITNNNLSWRNKKMCDVLSTAAIIRLNAPQIIAVSIKNVLLICVGMTIGFPTVLIGDLEDNPENFQLSHEQMSWIGAINLIFVPLGCLMSGPYAEKFGRRRAMQIANVPLALVWLLFHYASSVWHLYLGLAIVGILLGVSEAPVVTYVSEVTTPNLRGILFTASTMFTIVGTLCSFFLGSIYYWRTVAQICFYMPLISFALLFLIPESPHWLIKQHRHEEAQEALAWLRGWVRIEDVHHEYSTLNASIHHNGRSAKDYRSLSNYATRSFIKPYCLITCVFFVRHFSGITNVQTYAVELFAKLHAPMDKFKATTMMGVFELTGTVTCAILIRRFGKRKLTFGAMLLSALSLVTIPLYNYGRLGLDHNWIPMSGLFSYCYFSHCSLRVLPWVLIGEVFTPHTRSVASGFAAATGYMFGFLVNKLYFVFVDALTLNGLFMMYICVLLAGVIALYCIMPETEGKTLDEICRYFADENCSHVNRSVNKEINKCYCSSTPVVARDNRNGRERRRRSSISEGYTIRLDELDSNPNGVSYRRFDGYLSNDLGL